ncbi:hypothetical protein N7517_008847 [Penicillium concentricum]|uniref:Uncharacterized protein n=1 Tax=Penicillium concentricum TaxID=293559 RepID=A0A9W9RTI2_9EURO|nr:uncharacterized protein N7517_008847 [Penicillium concentricum]KAJ5365961.1 hypothetical protein N7517_008847 [Penicillium concentricum]
MSVTSTPTYVVKHVYFVTSHPSSTHEIPEHSNNFLLNLIHSSTDPTSHHCIPPPSPVPEPTNLLHSCRPHHPVPHYLLRQSPGELEIQSSDTILLSTSRRCVGFYDQGIPVSGTWHCDITEEPSSSTVTTRPLEIHSLTPYPPAPTGGVLGGMNQRIYVSSTWDCDSNEEPLSSDSGISGLSTASDFRISVCLRELILVYQCCPLRVDSGISLLPQRVANSHFSALRTQQLATTNLSVPPTLGHTKSQQKTTTILDEMVPTIPHPRRKISALVTFINMNFHSLLLSTSHWTGLAH